MFAIFWRQILRSFVHTKLYHRIMIVTEGPLRGATIDIGGIDRRLLCRSLDASRDH